jgi:hypothetical protein
MFALIIVYAYKMMTQMIDRATLPDIFATKFFFECKVLQLQHEGYLIISFNYLAPVLFDIFPNVSFNSSVFDLMQIQQFLKELEGEFLKVTSYFFSFMLIFYCLRVNIYTLCIFY